MRKFIALFFSILLIFSSTGIAPAYAADFRTGENVSISEGTTIEDAYLFGSNERI